jgi:predicted house-cleaning noncanonical NTP pyrophosphatase (MazG superfamily)
MRVTFNKLACDRVPEVIAQEGHRAVTHILDDDDLLRSLLTKLVEEARQIPPW